MGLGGRVMGYIKIRRSNTPFTRAITLRANPLSSSESRLLTPVRHSARLKVDVEYPMYCKFETSRGSPKVLQQVSPNMNRRMSQSSFLFRFSNAKIFSSSATEEHLSYEYSTSLSLIHVCFKTTTGRMGWMAHRKWK